MSDDNEEKAYEFICGAAWSADALLDIAEKGDFDDAEFFDEQGRDWLKTIAECTELYGEAATTAAEERFDAEIFAHLGESLWPEDSMFF